MSQSEPSSVLEPAPTETVGVVKNGTIVLPSSVKLPEGAEVRVVLVRPAGERERSPLERRPLTEDAVDADVALADGGRFPADVFGLFADDAELIQQTGVDAIAERSSRPWRTET